MHEEVVSQNNGNSDELDPNVYDHKFSDEVDYGTNQNRTVRVV